MTETEKNILTMMAEGRSPKEIAAILGTSEDRAEQIAAHAKKKAKTLLWETLGIKGCRFEGNHIKWIAEGVEISVEDPEAAK